jgi:MATE family multidrug resistance protein
MNKEILRLAIPNIISNVSVPLLSTVDTLLMGRMSAAHLGAVGIGSMIFNFIYWNFGFLRMGTTGMTAQAYGRNNPRQISDILGRAGILALIIAGLIMMVQIPLYNISAYLMNVQEAHNPLVAEYFFTRMWAAPATLMLYALMGWYFGMQNAFIPLFLTVLANVVNILLSAYFVRVLNLGIAGVAWGTVIAQYIALIAAIGFILWRYNSFVKQMVLTTLTQWHEMKVFLHINKDIFIRTVGLTFAFGFFYSQSSKTGEVILAANVVLLQFLNWMSYGIDGFAFAAESIIGKYHGREDKFMLSRSVKYCFFWGMAFAGLYTFIYVVWGRDMLYIFTDKEDIIIEAQKYLIWMIIFPLLSFPSYIWDGIFIGLTAVKSMKQSMYIALILYLGVFFSLYSLYGNHGLWLALLMLMIGRGIAQSIMYWRKGSMLK